jgi:hypothetical protein
VAEGDLTPSYRIAERSGLCYVRPVETAPPLRPRGWRSRATRGPATISMPCRAASSAQTGPWGVGHLLGKAEGFLARGENIAGVAEFGEHGELGAAPRCVGQHDLCSTLRAFLPTCGSICRQAMRSLLSGMGDSVSNPCPLGVKAAAAATSSHAGAHRHGRRAAPCARRMACRRSAARWAGPRGRRRKAARSPATRRDYKDK